MTEREMLELAAKTAGINGEWSDSFNRIEEFHGDQYVGPWNPPEDDGDCFRLEDALDIEIQRTPHAVLVHVNCGPSIVEMHTGHESKSAARRYASTRLAAEIGKNMS